jgi:hypothetical protein
MDLVENTVVINSAVEIKQPTTATDMKPQDSGLSSSATDSATNPTATNKPTITDYLDYFVHSLECKEPNCTMTKCRNFKRLFGHFKQCRKHFECESCRWLLNLIIIHSKACDNDTCNIPLCFTIKTRINEKEVLNRKMESIKEFINENSNALSYKPKCERTCQTCESDSAANSSAKRKLDEIESVDQPESTTVPQTEGFNEAELKKEALLEKLRLLKQQLLTSTNDNKDSDASLFEKSIRHDIVRFIVETNLKYVSSRESFSKNSFIPVTIHIIKKEQAIFKKVNSTDDYLYLMSELMHSIRTELEKHLIARNVGVECQVTEAELSESHAADVKTPSCKRIKTE